MIKVKNFDFVAVSGYPIIEIRIQKKIYDLHNAGEFISVNFNVSSRVAQLDWLYWENDKPLKDILRLSAKDVKSFEIVPRCNEMPISEDDCLKQVLINSEENIIKFEFWSEMKIIISTTELECNFVEQSI